MNFHSLIPLRVIALLIAFGSSNAFAFDFDYTYIQINNVIATDVSAGGYINYSGIGIDGSYELANNLSVIANVESGSYERVRSETYGELEFDNRELGIGLALHSAIDNKADLVINGSLFRNDQENTLVRDYDIGYNVQARIRYALADKIEIGANFTQINIFEHTGNSMGAEAFLRISPWLSVGSSFSSSADRDTLIFKLRFVF